MILRVNQWKNVGNDLNDKRTGDSPSTRKGEKKNSGEVIRFLTGSALDLLGVYKKKKFSCCNLHLFEQHKKISGSEYNCYPIN